MSEAEVGGYVRLLCHQADKYALSESMILKLVSASTWATIKIKFETDDAGNFFNQRMRQEHDKRKSFCASRREARQSGWDKIKGRNTSVIRTNKVKDRDFSKEFEVAWSQYPKAVGKKDALRHYRASVKTDEDVARVHKALVNYKASKQVADGFIKDGSSWFYQWEDWVEQGKAPEGIDKWKTEPLRRK